MLCRVARGSPSRVTPLPWALRSQSLARGSRVQIKFKDPGSRTHYWSDAVVERLSEDYVARDCTPSSDRRRNHARNNGDAFSDFQVQYYGAGAQSPYQLANETIPGVAGTNQVGPTGPLTTFYNDYTRTEEELAFFGQLAFDITDNLTATLGARKYDLETQLQGASNFSFGCRYGGNGGGGAADGFCNSHRFSNSPTDRFTALGAYNAGSLSDDQFLGLLNYPGAAET